MIGYDFVTIEVLNYAGRYVLTARARWCDEMPSPRWWHSTSTMLRVDGQNLQEILEAAAEEVFNLAPHADDPGY